MAAGERLADEGHIDLALRFLDVAATQANLADPGKPARSAVSAAALRVAVRPDDARLLAILAFAEPEEHGPLIVERAASDRDRTAARPRGRPLCWVHRSTLSEPSTCPHHFWPQRSRVCVIRVGWAGCRWC